eukprot:TRINITY_DN9311_c0_g1::TRINITY_DN9311_c0_g1_i1::g.13210::m.13210 TRINITY_DN9311_c0_g1::TRINITY_DN9311_c0_g1_i1::g.13210  ORF type:complete len:151 (-),score=68.58,sp/Q6ID70/Y3377_ARATH/38.00/6e-17,CS/PF04969.11/1.8e-09 TRINITY_DN9311_c0_g1_i1:218-670(-)
MTVVPTVLWAQRKDTIYINFDIPDLEQIKLNIEEDKIDFHGVKDGKTYETTLALLHPIDKEHSKQVDGKRTLQLVLKKKEAGPFWERLLKDAGKHPHVKVDWNLWLDEEDEEPNFDFGDLKDLNMGGFGQDEGDSDDEGDLPDLDGNPEQ